jgi:hypothetical protein
MTDEETICEWMEPRSKGSSLDIVAAWWKVRTVMTGTGIDPDSCFGLYRYAPLLEVCKPEHQLGFIHEIETRLSNEQWRVYGQTLRKITGGQERQLIHASASQKIRGLAVAVRPGPALAYGERR